MGYRPSDGQLVIHQDESMTTLVAGGWRAGKSVVTGAEITPHCLIPSPREYLIALIGPTYKEPRAEFEYIVEFLCSILPRSQFDPAKHVSKPKEGSCEFTIPGADGVHFATVRTYTAAEAENIRSFNAEAMVICEAGGISKSAFESLVGRVLSTGGFIFGSGTMETSQKWYQDLIKTGARENTQGVKSFILPSWTNSIVFTGGRQDEKILRIEALLDKETFDVRIAAQPVRVQGVVLRQLTSAHIADVKFDPSIPVELAIDPGYTGAYSVLAIQRYDSQIRVIDEVYSRFMSTKQVIDECKTRPWWNNIDVEDPGVIDRAAKQKQAATGDSVLDTWFEEAGLWLSMTEQVIGVNDGVEQARNHLSMPGHVLVSPNCVGLLAEADLTAFPEQFHGAEPWHYKRNNDGVYQGDEAVTGADHSSTAFIYYLVQRYGFLTMDDLLADFAPAHLMSIRGDTRFARTGREDEDYGPTGGLLKRMVG
jgi:hypothetical protein